jgi:hypothetical protein
MTAGYVILTLMNKIIAALFAVILTVSAPLSASAEEWNTMGPRAMGMGGAGVALAQGPLASYWNPAALGRATENSYGFTLPVSVHAGLTGPVLAGANDLKNAQNNCASLGATACQAQINAALGELSNPTNGLRVDGSASGDFKVGKIAVFANGFLDAGAVPRVDNVNTTQADIQNGTNTSALIVKGAEIMEFGAGYGHELPFAPGVYLGGDLKLMRAKVGYTSTRIINANNSQGKNGGSDIINQLKDGSASSANVGLDAGALWDVNKTFDRAWWSPRVGVTGRNLNNPKFTQAGAAVTDGVTGRYAVNPQARLGLAISPFHWWNLAADLDLTRNLTPVDGVASRQLGLGTEVNVFNRSWINIPLRFGLARNLETASNMVTLGSGINLLHLMLDFSGEFSPKSIDTQTQGSSKKIPQELGASISLSLLFGGSEDERGAKNPATDMQPVPTEKVITPAKASNDLPPAQADQIKANAAKSQTELNNEAAKPAPSGK